mgnify:CR=1 FL=1
MLSTKVLEFPNSRAATSLLAYCYYYVSDFQNALQNYERLMKMCPDVDEYRFYYAQALFKAARTKGLAAKKAAEDAVAKRAAFEPLKSAPPSPEKMAAFKAMKEAMKKAKAARKEFKEAKAAAQAGRKEVRDLVKDAAPLKMKAKRLSVAKKYIGRGVAFEESAGVARAR